MLNHQLILVDFKGRLRCTYAEPDMFAGGTPTKDGLLCIADKDAEVFNSGLGYLHSRSICIKQGGDDQGPSVDHNGRLRVSMQAGGDPFPQIPPKYWLSGLPFDQKGNLCLAWPELPTSEPLPSHQQF